MNISYLGHSCFKIEYNGASVIIDPYQNGKVPGLANLDEKANLVLCSHGHDDHNAAQLISVTGVSPFDVTFFETFHDEAQGTKRGMNKVHIIKIDGCKIVHMGDIGCELTNEQIDMLKDADLLMIPVGGFYTIDARQAIEMIKQISPKTVIPMHYRKDNIGFDEIATVDAFLDGFDKDDILFTNSEYNLADNKVVVMTPQHKE